MYSYLDDYKELRELISSNPDLPMMFICSEDCGDPDYGWTLGSAKARIKNVMIEKTPFNEEKLYTDEDDLKEDIESYIYEEHDGLSETQQEELANEMMKSYEDKWVKAIVIYVDAY